MKSPTEDYLNECRVSLKREQEASLAITRGWSHVDKDKVHSDWDLLYRQLAPMVQNALPEDEAVQSLIGEHFAIASRFYVPSKEAYIGLGIFYRENSEMRRFHNEYHPKMADFLEVALRHYALKNL